MSGSCNCGMLIDAYNLTTELIKATTQDEHNTRKRQSEIKPVAQPEQTGTPQVLEKVPQRTAGVEGPAVVAKIIKKLEPMTLRANVSKTVAGKLTRSTTMARTRARMGRRGTQAGIVKSIGRGTYECKLSIGSL